jgi:hypothetical protein
MLAFVLVEMDIFSTIPRSMNSNHGIQVHRHSKGVFLCKYDYLFTALNQGAPYWNRQDL